MKLARHLLLIVSLFAFKTAWATECSAIDRKPQTSFKGQSLYAQYMQPKFNKEVPKLCKDAIRLATHRITDSKRLKSLLDFIKTYDPTILFLQGVDKKHKASLEKELDKAGLTQRREFHDSEKHLEPIMFASKLPFDLIEAKRLEPTAEIMVIGIKVGDKQIAIIGMDNRRFPATPTEHILEFIKEKIAKTYTNYVLMGQLSHSWDPDVKAYQDSGLMKDSFHALNWPPPDHTSLSSRQIEDFILLSSALQDSLLGSYYFYPLGSINLIILADLKAPGISQSLPAAPSSDQEPFYSLSRYGWYIIIALIIVTILVAAGILLAVKRHSGHI